MEKPNSQGQNTFIVGLFVLLFSLVSAVFIVFMGGASFFTGEIEIQAHFKDVKGLNVGAPVFYSGLQVGRVSQKSFPNSADERGVLVDLSLNSRDSQRMSRKVKAEISTMGMLGDKVIVLIPNDDFSETLEDGDRIEVVKSKGIDEYLTKGESLVDSVQDLTATLNAILEEVHKSGHLAETLKNLDSLTAGLDKRLGSKSEDNLSPALKSLRNILAKVDKGEGTLGALVNDSSLHEDFKILLGGAQRSKLVRFMIRQAISGSEGKEVPVKEN